MGMVGEISGQVDAIVGHLGEAIRASYWFKSRDQDREGSREGGVRQADGGARGGLRELRDLIVMEM